MHDTRQTIWLQLLPLLLVLGSQPLGSQGRGSVPQAALVAPDNDVLFEDSSKCFRAPVPPEVQEKIAAIIDSERIRWAGTDIGDSGFAIAVAYSRLFRVAAPDHKYLYLYRFEGPIGSTYDFLIASDPSTHRVTSHPYPLWAKWTDLDAASPEQAQDTTGLLRKPLVFFEDIDGDERPEWVVEELSHNGTEYNAAVYYYLYLAPDLSFRVVLAFEKRALDPVIERDNRLIIRTLTKAAPSRLQLATYLQVAGSSRRQLGSAILENSGAGTPFQLRERHVLDPKYAFAIITASRWLDEHANEDRFLREGYTFYY